MTKNITNDLIIFNYDTSTLCNSKWLIQRSSIDSVAEPVSSFSKRHDVKLFKVQAVLKRVPLNV